MSRILNELTDSARSLWRRPVYSIVALVILALGLSAGIAVFTYINGFDQPFPGVDTHGLVRLFGVEEDDRYQDIPYLDFLDYAGADGAFQGLAASQLGFAASVRIETMTEVAFLEVVSGDYFSVLAVPLAIGRGITADDDRPGAEPVAVLSHGWWQRSFQGDRDVIGRTVYLNFRPFTIVGVMAPEFVGTGADLRPDVWIPVAPFKTRYTSWARLSEDRHRPLVRVYGRLRARVPEEQGLAELTAVAAGLDGAYPRAKSKRQVRLEKATWIDPRSRLAEEPTIRLMTVTAGVLLLLVCANAANLLLTVAVGRGHEMSVRAALGASPGRLAGRVLVENVLLSTLAGGVALLLAHPVGARLGSYFARPSVWGANVARETAIDLRVLLFAIAISVITGLIAGLLPAIRASRRELVVTLKSGGYSSPGGPGRFRGRRAPSMHDLLVSAQVALSITLLVVAGLALRTFVSVSRLDPGFSYDRLLVTHVSTSSTTLEAADRDRFFRALAARISDEPWVRTATVADFPLLSPHLSSDFHLDGQTDPLNLVYSKVLPGFFEALGIEVIQGRSFSDADTSGAPDVAMVNESLARRFYPEQHLVGRRIRWPADGGDRAFEIVGVVRDTKTQYFIADPEPTVYFSYPQHPYPTGSALMVVTHYDPAAAAHQLYRSLREIEPHLAIVNVVSYPEVVSGFLYTQRMNAEMFSVLAFLGLGLAAVGIFSVMSLAVSRRTREIGIRMSLGARRGDIARLIVGRAMIPVALGLPLGMAASLALTRLVRSLLFGVEPADPLTFAAGAGILVAAAMLAAYLPARRGTRVDPLLALRHE